MKKMKRLKRLYHIIVKRDIVTALYTKKFEKFGHDSVLYHPLCIRGRENICIGNQTTILNGVRMQVYNDLTGKQSKIKIGDNCYIGYNNTFLAGGNITLEDGVLMASNILISSENHSINPESPDYYMNQKLSCAPIIVGEGTWIGEKVSILSGVTIGKKCVIGAGSIVTKDIPDFSIAVGSPAKVIKKYNFNTHEWENANVENK